ncbi:peptidylprolyl isomerase [Allofranklinella schreckenbergeri]|uniref:peptidylprolyl isomerase n=1 Tax=Allofranklinella schreckenbergeri TaxID=1076744 RepID=A0A3M6QDF5_9BURK|nr:peptidylprolyl isomerase [Allofranklinella schreckenbergeri]RMX00681.1 peptidylprolyl isomerase [Allofranklinella schreckenbergeri]
MPITVNGVELCDAEVEQELPKHQDADNPLHQAVIARILRRVMLDEAARLGIDTADEEQAVSDLLEQQAPYPTPDDDACRRFYAANQARYVVGECIEADHILFQVTPGVNLQGLILQAEDVLARLQEQPERFAEFARHYSNCPSSALGGNLGQISRGDTVPEFERVAFGIAAGTIHPKLVHSRHGLHIIRVNRRSEGKLRPYEDIAGEIAQALGALGRDTAWRQYAKVLVSRADITGIDLDDDNADRLLLDPNEGKRASAPAQPLPEPAGSGCGSDGHVCTCAGGN